MEKHVYGNSNTTADYIYLFILFSIWFLRGKSLWSHSVYLYFTISSESEQKTQNVAGTSIVQMVMKKKFGLPVKF